MRMFLIGVLISVWTPGEASRFMPPPTVAEMVKIADVVVEGRLVAVERKGKARFVGVIEPLRLWKGAIPHGIPFIVPAAIYAPAHIEVLDKPDVPEGSSGVWFLKWDKNRKFFTAVSSGKSIGRNAFVSPDHFWREYSKMKNLPEGWAKDPEAAQKAVPRGVLLDIKDLEWPPDPPPPPSPPARGRN